MKKKIANLSAKSLYEMGDAMKVQKSQQSSLEQEKDEISDGIDHLENITSETRQLANEADLLIDELLLLAGQGHKNSEDAILALQDNTQEVIDTNYSIKRTETIQTQNDWERYVENFSDYSDRYAVDISKDPFSTLLSQRQYEELKKQINDDFAKKTSIKNKTDLSFLAIAIGLQVAKALVFPLAAEKVGYGNSFDKENRLAENDKSIIAEEKSARNEYKNKNLAKGKEPGEWLEVLYRTPPYDITKGSPAIGFNMEGKYHRIHTLGHDPILGWIFGTANILTDTVTFDTFATYKVARNPMLITPERVPFVSLVTQTIAKTKEGPMFLPAALVAEKIHLKSDEFTKCGLPIPVLETFAPEFAGKLYKNQYDALCFSRDLKVIGSSAAISMLIDMVIGLVHGLYYDKEKDGTKDMFEVRTRKILLISNAIASTSNIIYATVTQNPKALDIGGLLVTIAHLCSDTRFILNVKKEFIENRIDEKIESEMKAIEESQGKLLDFEYEYIIK